MTDLSLVNAANLMQSRYEQRADELRVELGLLSSFLGDRGAKYLGHSAYTSFLQRKERVLSELRNLEKCLDSIRDIKQNMMDGITDGGSLVDPEPEPTPETHPPVVRQRRLRLR